jgi:hypothetical protein
MSWSRYGARHAVCDNIAHGTMDKVLLALVDEVSCRFD